MTLKHKLIGISAAALLMIAGAVLHAQVPGIFIVSPVGTEQIDLRNAGPQIVDVYLAQIRDSSGYEKIVPTTGQTLQIPNYISQVQMTPAGGLSALTLTTPIAPFDGAELRIYTTQAITTFNLVAASGQTVNGNLAGTLSANSGVSYLYSISNQTWDRVD